MYLPGDSLTDNGTLIHRKIVGPAVGGGIRAFIDHQALPFRDLAPRDLLDTADLCRIFGCSARTVYRWIGEREDPLPFKFKAGREFLFSKSDLLRWYAANRPRPGRPPTQWR